MKIPKGINLRLGGEDVEKVEYCRVTADELAYLQACAAAIEDLSHIDATDATIAMFFKRDAKKLAKMRRTK